MALLAEQLVDEWLNRRGFFTLRGIKQGVNEIDLLGIRKSGENLEGWHIEVQVSFRPISYIGKLSAPQRTKMGVNAPNSAKKRPHDILSEGIDDFIEKKFYSSKKKEMREKCWRGISWKFKFVHGVVHEKEELKLIGDKGIELIQFSEILKELCAHRSGELFGGAGTDIAEIIRYYSDRPDTAI